MGAMKVLYAISTSGNRSDVHGWQSNQSQTKCGQRKPRSDKECQQVTPNKDSESGNIVVLVEVAKTRDDTKDCCYFIPIRMRPRLVDFLKCVHIYSI